MQLPEDYLLRANYSFVPDQMLTNDDCMMMNEVLAGIATDLFSVTQVRYENNKNTCNGLPVISLHINRDATLIQLSAYSCSVRREHLFEEAIMLQSILATVFENKSGVLTDHLSQSIKKLEQNTISTGDVSFNNLYQVQLVSLADSYFIHTHGLVKFACADFEWQVAKTTDISLIANVFDQFINKVLKGEFVLLQDVVMSWQGQAFQFHMEDLGMQHKEHYGFNSVVRITVNSTQESQAPQVKNTRLNREEYFYGRQ